VSAADGRDTNRDTVTQQQPTTSQSPVKDVHSILMTSSARSPVRPKKKAWYVLDDFVCILFSLMCFLCLITIVLLVSFWSAIKARNCLG